MRLPFEIWASPEPTIARIDATTVRDQGVETGHDARESDLDLIAGLGVTATRYPVLWERCETGSFEPPDFSHAAPRLERLRALGVEPIVTLLHHGSGPLWTNLLDENFAWRFGDYAEAAAHRFPWIKRWTPINEPLTTARFSTLYGHWYPNVRDDRSFGRAITNEALAIVVAMERIAKIIPEAQFMITEDLQGFRALEPSVEEYVEHKRARMYLALDLVMGNLAEWNPMYDYLTERCEISTEALGMIERRARKPDLIGWNYYPASERVLFRDRNGIRNDAASTVGPISPLPLLRAAYRRLGIPFGLSEVHRHGHEWARVEWLRQRTADLRTLQEEGLPVRMLGAWGAFGLVDWTSLLIERREEREDGIFTCAPEGTPQETAVAAELRRLTRS